MTRRRQLTAGLMALIVAISPGAATAAELQDRTNRAYDAYAEKARRSFVDRARYGVLADRRNDGVVRARPAYDDGIIGVPGGLVHHWSGSVFVPDVGLRAVVELARSYSSYRSIYKEIIASTVVAADGDRYLVMMRLKEGEAGVTAVLDVHSTVQYFFPTDRNAYTLSNADDIREVARAGTSGERLLPRGRDSGYLWRANVFTQFMEVDHGVYMEVETLGLSRSFPPLLGWLIEPIARRLGRRSVVRSLEEFRAAIRPS